MRDDEVIVAANEHDIACAVGRFQSVRQGFSGVAPDPDRCLREYPEALARIRKIKQRSSARGFILVSDALERLLPCLDWDALSESQHEKMLASWSGPVTWLVPASSMSGSKLRGDSAVLLSGFLHSPP